MQLKLSSQLGLNYLDTHTVISNDDHPELPDWRETIKRTVAAYIEATGRFSERTPDRPHPDVMCPLGSLAKPAFTYRSYSTRLV